MTINNVTRLLDAKKIPYQVFSLPLQKFGALETARFLNIPPEIVFKSIIIKREKPGKYVVAVIPGNCEVSLKQLAEVLNEKKVWLSSQSEAENVTGLQVGGISPLALLHKGFTTVLDSAAINLSMIHISGGQIGLNIRIHPEDLIKLTNARVAQISEVII